MLQHTGRFGQGFLGKGKCDNNGPYPYSPDLAPADFYLFPLLKSALKVLNCCDARDVIRDATEELKSLSGMASRIFPQFYSCGQTCIVAQGCLFEGNVA